MHGWERGGNQVPILMESIPKVYDVNAAKELDRANTLDTSCRGVWGKQNGTVVYSLEGNGSRESHNCPGFTDSDKMYTLNTVEHHAVATIFEPGVATKDGGHVYTDGKAPTLRANPGDNFPTVAQPVSTTGGQVWVASKASFMTRFTSDKAGSLTASDWKDAPVVVTESKQLEACAPMTDEDSTDKM